MCDLHTQYPDLKLPIHSHTIPEDTGEVFSILMGILHYAI